MPQGRIETERSSKHTIKRATAEVDRCSRLASVKLHLRTSHPFYLCLILRLTFMAKREMHMSI